MQIFQDFLLISELSHWVNLLEPLRERKPERVPQRVESDPEDDVEPEVIQ